MSKIDEVKKILNSEPIKFFPSLETARVAQAEKNDRLANQIAFICEAECQKRIKGLIEKIEDIMPWDSVYSDYCWQTIKKEHNV